MIRPIWPSRDSALLWIVALAGPLTAAILYAALVLGPSGFRPIEREIVAAWVALPVPVGAYVARWFVGSRGAGVLNAGLAALALAAACIYLGSFGPGSRESLAGLSAIFFPLLQWLALPVLIFAAWWVGAWCERSERHSPVELPRSEAILPRNETDR